MLPSSSISTSVFGPYSMSWRNASTVSSRSGMYGPLHVFGGMILPFSSRSGMYGRILPFSSRSGMYGPYSIPLSLSLSRCDFPKISSSCESKSKSGGSVLTRHLFLPYSSGPTGARLLTTMLPPCGSSRTVPFALPTVSISNLGTPESRTAFGFPSRSLSTISA